MKYENNKTYPMRSIIIVAWFLGCIIPEVAVSASLLGTVYYVSGANDVSVNGQLYDVRWSADPCPHGRGNCTEKKEFIFDEAGAVQASKALLDQVFIGEADWRVNDGRKGSGHQFRAIQYLTPYEWLLNPTRNSTVKYADATNANVEELDFAGIRRFQGPLYDIDYYSGDARVWALWTLAQGSEAIVEVPTPPSVLILIPGVLGLIVTRRKRALQKLPGFLSGVGPS